MPCFLGSWASPIRDATHKIHVKGLEVLKKKTDRQLRIVPWFLTNKDIKKDLQLTSVKDFHKILSKKYFEKLDSNENVVLLEIAEYDPKDP
ncbi:hypothetical protein AVEN_275138-1 [Araneus ventricosus]|uniref:Uncharacterized protein n=1 Tax=Araneus ventricosus TaxID=182803 RepID=A0A4Y2MF33_ARAVE|nr:hypothetical protein AVEN_275138-1 [Araneus ventricosus]